MQSKFRLIAVGELFKFIPFIFGLFLALVFRYINDDEAAAIIGLGGVGMLVGMILSIAGAFSMARPLKEAGIGTGSAITLGITFISYPVMVICLIGALGLFVFDIEKEIAPGIIVILFGSTYFLISALGMNRLTHYFHGASRVKTGYVIMFIAMAAAVVGMMIAVSKLHWGYYYSNYETIFHWTKALSFMMLVAWLVGAIMVISGWFGMAREADALAEGNEPAEEEVADEIVVETEPVEETVIVTEVISEPAVKAMPFVPEQPAVDPYIQQLIDYAKTLTSEQLEYVLANPDKYEADFMRVCADELARR